jgi:hypothetical protein
MHRAVFESKEDAERELDKLKPLIGQDRFRNDRAESHTITTPAGPWCVAVDKIESARVLDDVEHNRICAGAPDFSIEYEAKKAAAIARAQREA